MLAPSSLCRTVAFSQIRQYCSSTAVPISRSTITRPRAPCHSTGPLLVKKHKGFFSSNAPSRSSAGEEKKAEIQQPAKRRSTRPSSAPNSLRRVALEAQRSRDGKEKKKVSAIGQDVAKTVTAICTAQEYDVAHVARILEGSGHQLDPYDTDLYPQVIHVALPFQNQVPGQDYQQWTTGDLFIFPSGTVVAWDIPDAIVSTVISQALLPAATSPLSKAEKEDLQYLEDSARDSSSIKGDRIVLGIKAQPSNEMRALSSSDVNDNESPIPSQHPNLDAVLAKIAFSSGLARSTKLAVLERLLDSYFESTKTIPEVLSRGGRMPFTRSFISQKTGQLLSIRAQLNLYSELTDSLPDLFWDSRHELGLEGYYDQVGRALDTNIRIKVLNEKMDYAQEIASVLRQQLSEKHSSRLEWIIIVLIAVEVLFAVDKEVKEYRERTAARGGFLDEEESERRG